jgi:hypothetical protein
LPNGGGFDIVFALHGTEQGLSRVTLRDFTFEDSNTHDVFQSMESPSKSRNGDGV